MATQKQIDELLEKIANKKVVIQEKRDRLYAELQKELEELEKDEEYLDGLLECDDLVQEDDLVQDSVQKTPVPPVEPPPPVSVKPAIKKSVVKKPLQRGESSPERLAKDTKTMISMLDEDFK